jgi:CRP-like cAMP-binding protein/predicted GNAT family N-acyltransferase
MASAACRAAFIRGRPRVHFVVQRRGILDRRRAGRFSLHRFHGMLFCVSKYELSARRMRSQSLGIIETVPESATFDLLRTYCGVRQFGAADVLREKGHHYHDMYLIANGSAAVRLSDDDATSLILLGPGSPVGEISFLRGCAATATVLAQTPTEAIVIDDAALAIIEHERPALAAQLFRYLAETAEERMSHNLTSASSPGHFGNSSGIEVYLCNDDELTQRAQRLRYEVYCEELGRDSPNADHAKRIITDQLDQFGHTFVAMEDGQAIGTIRGNMSFEGPIGSLQELYGMKQSPHHPHGTSVVTKFVVTKSKRGSLASFKLISALTRFGIRNNMKECYIDSIPSLLPYYKAIGFRIVAPKFFHAENGPSIPMKLDLLSHGERLCRDPSPFTLLQLYLKAQTIRIIDRIGERLSPRTAGG